MTVLFAIETTDTVFTEQTVILRLLVTKPFRKKRLVADFITAINSSIKLHTFPKLCFLSIGLTCNTKHCTQK